MTITLERSALSDTMEMLQSAHPQSDTESEYESEYYSDLEPQKTATVGGHRASLDKPVSPHAKKPKYTISSSSLHKLSPLFPKSSLPPRTERYREYFEYRAYLDSTLEAIRRNAKTRGITIDVTPEQLVKDLPFWTRDKVVWPNILHNGYGGIVFHWVADSLNLRVERFSDRSFRIQTWHSLDILGPKVESSDESKLDPYDFLKDYVPAMYDAIADKYHPDWKSFFEPVS